MIIAALGCRQLKEAQEIICKYGQIIIGSMDGSKVSYFLVPRDRRKTAIYFYETG